MCADRVAFLQPTKYRRWLGKTLALGKRHEWCEQSVYIATSSVTDSMSYRVHYSATDYCILIV